MIVLKLNENSILI